MKKLRLYLTLILTLAAFSTPVLAQPGASPDLQGDITIVDGQDLETSLENALTNAVTEATDQLSSGTTVGGLFSSPAFLTTVFALVNAILVFLTTNAVKLQTMLRGNKTLLLASLLSAVTSGLGVYFGPGAALGVPERIALAVAAALGTLGGAVGIHETRRAAQTGQRKPERTGVSDVVNSPVGQLAKSGLVALAIKYALPGGGLLVDALLSEHTLEQAERIIHNMGKKRALNQVEIEKNQDDWEAANPIPKVVRKPDSFESPLPTPNPSSEGV